MGDHISRLSREPCWVMEVRMFRRGPKGIRIAASAAVLLLGSSYAGAAEKVFTDTVGWLPTDWLNGSTGVQQLSFPKFDPSWGTLTSVTVELTGEIQSSVTFNSIENGSQLTKLGTETYVALENSELGFDGIADGNEEDIVLVQAIKNWPLGSTTVNAGDTLDVNVSGTNDWQKSYSSPADLSLFIGGAGDLLEFLVSTITDTTLTIRAGNGSATQVTSARVQGKITYNYEYAAVPEATTLLLGTAAGMPLVMHRRRRRTA